METILEFLESTEQASLPARKTTKIRLEGAWWGLEIYEVSGFAVVSEGWGSVGRKFDYVWRHEHGGGRCGRRRWCGGRGPTR